MVPNTNGPVRTGGQEYVVGEVVPRKGVDWHLVVGEIAELLGLVQRAPFVYPSLLRCYDEQGADGSVERQGRATTCNQNRFISWFSAAPMNQ